MFLCSLCPGSLFRKCRLLWINCWIGVSGRAEEWDAGIGQEVEGIGGGSLRSINISRWLWGESIGGELNRESTLVLLIRLVVTAVVGGEKCIIENGIESFQTTGSGLFNFCIRRSMNRS